MEKRGGNRQPHRVLLILFHCDQFHNLAALSPGF